MDNDDKPIGRVLNRREIMHLFGASGLAFLAGCGGGSGSTGATTTSGSSSGSTLGNSSGSSSGSGSNSGSSSGVVVTPDLTEGPFFVDERLNRSNITTGTTRASVVNGLPLTLQLKVYQISGSAVSALSGAQVDIWHADALGTYSDENNSVIQSENTRGQTWLRGYQVTDANGAVTFTTIYPGWYMGRTIHIHFKIRLFSSSGAEAYDFTSQFFMDDAINDIVMANAPYNSRGTRNVRNANDGIYSGTGTDGIIDGTQLTLSLTQTSGGNGYVGTFNIYLQM